MNDINAQVTRLRNNVVGAQSARWNERIGRAAASARHARGMGLLGARDSQGRLRDRTTRIGTGRFASQGLSNG